MLTDWFSHLSYMLQTGVCSALIVTPPVRLLITGGLLNVIKSSYHNYVRFKLVCELFFVYVSVSFDHVNVLDINLSCEIVRRVSAGSQKDTL